MEGGQLYLALLGRDVIFFPQLLFQKRLYACFFIKHLMGYLVFERKGFFLTMFCFVRRFERDNGPHELRCLNVWSPVSGSVQEGIGGATQLEQVQPCQRRNVTGVGLEISNNLIIPIQFSLCFQLARKILASTLVPCLPISCHVSHCDDHGI